MSCTNNQVQATPAWPAAPTCTHERQHHGSHQAGTVLASFAEEQHWPASLHRLCTRGQHVTVGSSWRLAPHHHGTAESKCIQGCQLACTPPRSGWAHPGAVNCAEVAVDTYC